MTLSVAAVVLAVVLAVYLGSFTFVSWLLWSAIQRARSPSPNEDRS